MVEDQSGVDSPEAPVEAASRIIEKAVELRAVILSEDTAAFLLQMCRRSTAGNADTAMALGKAHRELEMGLAALNPPEATPAVRAAPEPLNRARRRRLAKET